MIRRVVITLIAACASVVAASGQQPKLDLKVYGGYHTHVFVYKAEDVSKDVLHGYQGGFGFRVSYRKLMGEIDFDFVRNLVKIPIDDSIGLDADRVDIKINAFELPIKGGIIPVKTPLFKWYVYTGLGIRVNTRARFKIGDEEFKYKPSELGLANPNVDFLLGTQFDIAWINLEVLYRLGVNNSLTESIRTNSHEIHFNIGVLF